jgi:hypothetical protein
MVTIGYIKLILECRTHGETIFLLTVLQLVYSIWMCGARRTKKEMRVIEQPRKGRWSFGVTKDQVRHCATCVHSTRVKTGRYYEAAQVTCCRVLGRLASSVKIASIGHGKVVKVKMYEVGAHPIRVCTLLTNMVHVQVTKILHTVQACVRPASDVAKRMVLQLVHHTVIAHMKIKEWCVYAALRCAHTEVVRGAMYLIERASIVIMWKSRKRAKLTRKSRKRSTRPFRLREVRYLVREKKNRCA